MSQFSSQSSHSHGSDRASACRPPASRQSPNQEWGKVLWPRLIHRQLGFAGTVEDVDEPDVGEAVQVC